MCLLNGKVATREEEEEEAIQHNIDKLEQIHIMQWLEEEKPNTNHQNTTSVNTYTINNMN